MSDDQDQYEAYYAEKLWTLLPSLYRAADTTLDGQHGPLRELVNRIGVQAAILRRSIDRLWEDQSIETCDDWVIPYIAQLLQVNLAESLDVREQRLEVANTIDYRRRKGAVGMLEQLAVSVAGWQAYVVESFRRLARTRHLLDPAIGWPASAPDPGMARKLQIVQGLTGRLTGTGVGGWADLRNAYGASRTRSPFDEFFYSADTSAGSGPDAGHTLSALDIFLWRLQSVPVGKTTPVRVAGHPGEYTFDPTGRDVPLFAITARSFGNAWVSPKAWQLPGPISRGLLNVELSNLYAVEDATNGTLTPNALGVYHRHQHPHAYALIPSDQISAEASEKTAEWIVDPERGRVRHRDSAHGSDLRVTYCYGAVSEIGAGAYDRRIAGVSALAATGSTTAVTGGGDALDQALRALEETGAGTGTIAINDFLTYEVIRDLSAIQQVTLGAANQHRPVIRLRKREPEPERWIFSGQNASSSLLLDGLFVSGGDLILRGDFDSVTLRCCTLDPGSCDEAHGGFARAADDRDLLPCHLWIEGTVRQLTLDRCIVGPIQTREAGAVELLTASDSILQALECDAMAQAIHLGSGSVTLDRCTVLGRVDVPRLNAGNCILDEIVHVQDVQSGCVRYTAWAKGSVLPGPYESIAMPPRSTLFTSRTFGDPAFAQLQLGVSAAIANGGEDGSEMGAYAREQTSIKERSLQLKFAEYMPVGLTPLFHYVT
ncbi:MAG TPA: hypothetical protein VKU00_10250 [Chthonomonadaceae bacterium]|nr:hypothetical protein [Chthonomonadaceae bacterium]